MKKELNFLSKSFYKNFICKMSLNIKRYREVSREYLLKVIERKKKESTYYPVSLYDNNLGDDLKKSGFFDKYKKIKWWRQEICPKIFRCIYTPIFEYDSE